jgi:hypothetical protein
MGTSASAAVRSTAAAMLRQRRRTGREQPNTEREGRGGKQLGNPETGFRSTRGDDGHLSDSEPDARQPDISN